MTDLPINGVSIQVSIFGDVSIILASVVSVRSTKKHVSGAYNETRVFFQVCFDLCFTRCFVGIEDISTPFVNMQVHKTLSVRR